MLQDLEMKSPFVFEEEDDRWNAVVYFKDTVVNVLVFREILRTDTRSDWATHVALYAVGPHPLDPINSSDGDVFFGVPGMNEAGAIAEYAVKELQFLRRIDMTTPNLTTVLEKAKKFGPNPTPEIDPSPLPVEDAKISPFPPVKDGKSPGAIVYDDQSPIKASGLALKYFQRLVEFQSDKVSGHQVISCRKSLELDGWRVIIGYFRFDYNDESFATLEIDRENGDLIEFDLFAKIADR